MKSSQKEEVIEHQDQLLLDDTITEEEKDKRLVKENDSKIIKHITAMCIIFLKAKVNKKFLPHLSYHLHFTISAFQDEYTVFCLDTGNIVTDKKNKIATSLDRLCVQFVDTLFYSLTNKIETADQVLFANKASNDFWDKFNDIKTNSFYNNMKQEIYEDNIIDNIQGFRYEYKKYDFSVNGEISEYRMAS